jgi:hypothetical protein
MIRSPALNADAARSLKAGYKAMQGKKYDEARAAFAAVVQRGAGQLARADAGDQGRDARRAPGGRARALEGAARA